MFAQKANIVLINAKQSGKHDQLIKPISYDHKH